MRKTRYFEWIAGEDIGEICILSHVEVEDGETYLHFTNGDVCNISFVSPMTTDKNDIKDKFMVEISGPSQAWRLEDPLPKVYTDYETKESVEIPSLDDMLYNKTRGPKLVPPQVKITTVPDLPNIKDWGIVKVNPVDDIKRDVNPVVTEVPDLHVDTPVPVFEPKEEPKPEPQHNSFDPVSILVNTCKRHETDIDLTITIKLPSRSMFDIADNEFENGGKKFIDCVVKDISTKMIVESIKDALNDYYCGGFAGIEQE